MQLLRTEGDRALVRPTTGNQGGLEFWIDRRYLKTGEGVNPRWVENAVNKFLTQSVDMSPNHCARALRQALSMVETQGDADEWMRRLVDAGQSVPRAERDVGTLVWYPTSKPEGHIGIMAYDSNGKLRMISQKSGRITWEDPPGSAVYMRLP